MKILHLLTILFFSLCILAFNACTNSDEYLFNESDTTTIQVSAYMTRSFEKESDRRKQDTIVPGDSLIFLTSISPSKSIRLQKYYWTIDGDFFANEYSFKNTVYDPGLHQISFVLVDFFGDTLSDTLHLFVASPPEMDTQKFIPRDNTQGIDPSAFLNFVWSSNAEDSLWQISYHFMLKDTESDEIIVDTLLQSPQFSYIKGFKTLSKYEWSVQAYNELNQTSQETLRACFFTSGFKNEGGLSGTLKTSSSDVVTKFDLTILNEADSTVRQIKNYETDERGFFKISPLEPGHYTIITKASDFSDFTPDTTEFFTEAKILTEVSAIVLKDRVFPTIKHESELDTLDIADTLKFYVHDGGGPLSLSKISSQLESSIISSITLIGDTLLVPLPKSIENSWTYRLLTVSVLDQSGNKFSRSFYIKPKRSFEEVRG